MKKESSNQILWYSLAVMAFSTVWGFGNIINGFSEYGGLKAIAAWLLIFAIYFIPYALMVGELGSTFKNEGGGVSSWINQTIGPKMAYFAGWTYWVVHMPYISEKPGSVIIACSWAIFRDNRVSQMSTMTMQLIRLVIFVMALLLASRGIRVLRRLSTLAGTAMFAMSLLFILLMIAAPALTNAEVLSIDWTPSTFTPNFNPAFFLNISILVYAVGGCEKMSPYVNKMKDPSRDFSKGMIALTGMVVLCAVLGTIALGMMFDSNHIPGDLMTNGAYYAFQQLGVHYGLGDLFLILYAICNIITQVSVIILSVDAPLRIMLNNVDTQYVPSALLKQNKYGAYSNGLKLVFVIVSVIIIVPALGISNVDVLVKWLVKLNSVCMPLRYLWVFAAYIALKKAGERFPATYRFVKNRRLGMFLGGWCFALTAYACLSGIYSDDPFRLMLNIITPFILIGLGFIMPYFAKRERMKAQNSSEQNIVGK
ncbi:amino acid permease [Oscillibacter sp.]|uniref:APC family permease n=1 Tax=Oscillibacter sp. TaxID=1945593 RepID=UPI00289AFCA4|nr:amino acid permease [Oscillibacter sp.]